MGIMREKEFKPGFRILPHDWIIIVSGIGFLIYFYTRFPMISLITGLSVGHFFLFCNVFRIRRIPELIWASFFIFLVYYGTNISTLSGYLISLISISVGLILIAFETKHPSYHGIFWKFLNPDLKKWWVNQNH